MRREKKGSVCLTMARGARVRGKYFIGVLSLFVVPFVVSRIDKGRQNIVTHESVWLHNSFLDRFTCIVKEYTEFANRPGTPGKMTW